MKKKKLRLARETVHALQDVSGGWFSSSCISDTCAYSRAFSNCAQSCLYTCYQCPGGGGTATLNPEVPD